MQLFNFFAVPAQRLQRGEKIGFREDNVAYRGESLIRAGQGAASLATPVTWSVVTTNRAFPDDEHFSLTGRFRLSFGD